MIKTILGLAKREYGTYIFLTDYSTSTLLLIEKDWQTMGFLNEFTLDSVYTFWKPKNWLEYRLVENLSKSTELYRYGHNRKTNKIIKLNKVDPKMESHSRLAKLKYNLIYDVMMFVQYQRQLTRRTLAFQEGVYLSKRIEAENFKKAGYKIEDILNYPHILSYAEYKNISYKEAADAILTKVSLGDADLAKTDIFRIKFFNKIKNAKTEEEIRQIDKEAELEISILM